MKFFFNKKVSHYHSKLCVTHRRQRGFVFEHARFAALHPAQAIFKIKLSAESCGGFFFAGLAEFKVVDFLRTVEGYGGKSLGQHGNPLGEAPNQVLEEENE